MSKLALKLGLQTKIMDSGCWEWQGRKSEKGYGLTKVDGRHKRVHRLVFAIWHGEIPEGLFICHRCDNPACINPEHLFLGTHQDNMEDAYRKGRITRKLTPDIVRAIRESALGSVVLGRLYGVNPKTIWEIKNYKIWKSVP